MKGMPDAVTTRIDVPIQALYGPKLLDGYRSVTVVALLTVYPNQKLALRAVNRHIKLQGVDEVISDETGWYLPSLTKTKNELWIGSVYAAAVPVPSQQYRLAGSIALDVARSLKMALGPKRTNTVRLNQARIISLQLSLTDKLRAATLHSAMMLAGGGK